MYEMTADRLFADGGFADRLITDPSTPDRPTPGRRTEKMLVRHGATGFIAEDAGFSQAIAAILENPSLHAAMRCAARADAMHASWDSVFEKVYDGYRSTLSRG